MRMGMRRRGTRTRPHARRQRQVVVDGPLSARSESALSQPRSATIVMRCAMPVPGPKPGMRLHTAPHTTKLAGNVRLVATE